MRVQTIANTKITSSIKIENNENLGTQAVSAKTLYHELTNGDIKNYSRWIKKNILENDFAIYKEDYIILHNEDYSGRGQTSTDYALTIDFAKELCMMSKCQKGKEIRKYFIECEKELKALAPAQDSYMIADPIARAKRWIEEQQERKELLETTKKQEQVILELKPKADYTDDILQNKGVVAITQIAKDYGMSGKAMNAKLHELGIIYKLGEQWLLYSKYQSCGYTHSETVAIKHTDGRSDVKLNTKWTQKGRLFLYNKLKCHGVLPMIEM